MAAAATTSTARAATRSRSSSLLGKILRIDPQRVGRQGVHDPVLESVRRARGRPRRDLLLRAAQPVALLLRQRHRRPRRSATSGRTQVEEIDFVKKGGGRGRELRLAPVGGPPAQLQRAGAARDLPGHHAHPPGRLLLDHGRLHRARPRRARALRALRLRRLLQEPPARGHAARRPARPEPDAGGAARLQASRRSARTPRAPLRDLGQRAGLPLRGALRRAPGGALA